MKETVLSHSLRRLFAGGACAGPAVLALPAQAQEEQPAAPMQRVEITGSSIKRIAAEGALPVTVMTAAAIRESGVTSAADLVTTSGGALTLVGDPLQAAPYGLGFAKDRTALRDAVQVALQESIADGGYDEVLAAHRVEAAALTTTALNGGA